ncbi:MAG: 4Fe-4S binding protein [Burkholderiaceae bacterium]
MSALALAPLGNWLQRNGRLIRRVQWVVVLFYVFLLVVPALLPLPDESAHIVNNLTIFAQFVFWGIWWPFVLLSMVLVGRVWCGVLCPEGSLTEWASSKGRGHSIPRWMRWGGWPFVAFSMTTLYGQLVSVYQYPKAVLLVLGGSTMAAIVVGYLYGREKRVWCKYLCPVNGVFELMSKLAPMHNKVDADAWRKSYLSVTPIPPINCAPLVAMRQMQGASDCHMCGRCSGHRDAITLTARAPNHEVVKLGAQLATGWHSVLILFGLLGIALGAFQWTVNPHFLEAKQWIAEWLIERNILWPFAENAPWWVLTNYPVQRDVFSWLDGALVAGYILGMGALMGCALSVIIGLASRLLGPWQRQRFYHLCQALIPLAGCGVFLGLSALTVNLLKNDGIPVSWVGDLRLMLLIGASLWSFWLATGITRQYVASALQRCAALGVFALALALVDINWVLMFWIW